MTVYRVTAVFYTTEFNPHDYDSDGALLRELTRSAAVGERTITQVDSVDEVSDDDVPLSDDHIDFLRA